MTVYVIERASGEFLSDPHTNGTGKSFTRSLQKARVFATREAAHAECCDNEHPVPMTALMMTPEK